MKGILAGAGFAMIAALTFAAAAGAAQLNAEPGLWKTTVKSHRNGMDQAPRTNTNCVTQKQIEDMSKAFAPPQDSGQMTCKQTKFSETSDSVNWKYDCTGQITISSEGSIKLDSPHHYTGKMSFKGNAMGQPIDDSSTMEGERLGPCTAATREDN